jgi:hypothetical protein
VGKCRNNCALEAAFELHPVVAQQAVAAKAAGIDDADDVADPTLHRQVGFVLDEIALAVEVSVGGHMAGVSG